MSQMNEDRPFEGRRALVSGGSRGIAAAISRALARAGAEVALNFSADADERLGLADAADALVAEIASEGGRAIAIEQDLMEEGGGTLLARKAQEAVGEINTLVLSASIQHNLPFLRQTPDHVASQLRLNVTANIELLQALIPDMAANGYGRILTIGSIQEVAPGGEMPIYAMTKAAMKNLVESLSQQGARHGIIVNNIAPGLIATDRNAFRRADAEDWNRVQERANPVGRAGRPEDLTALALNLLSPANTFTTGATVYATGGAHIPAAGAPGNGGLGLPEEETAHAAE